MAGEEVRIEDVRRLGTLRRQPDRNAWLEASTSLPCMSRLGFHSGMDLHGWWNPEDREGRCL